MGVNRLMVANKVMAPETVLVASSSAAGSPVSNLKDQLPSKTWRSETGWVITNNNNRIDFNRGGVKAATITNATYATGTAMAAAIVAALNTADPGQSWACTYSGSNIFTISASPGFFLLFGTGANKAASVHPDLSFLSEDTDGTNSHAATGQSHQSRHMLHLDFMTVWALNACIEFPNNLVNASKWQGHSTSMLSMGYGSTTPAFSQDLGGPARGMHILFAQNGYRYQRLIINDVFNPVGYAEIGIWYLGDIVSPPKAQFSGWGKALQSQNELSYAVGGAHFVDERPQREAWRSLRWPGLNGTQKNALMNAFAQVPIGVNFFFNFDSADSLDTEYVMLGDEPSFDHVEGVESAGHFAFTVNCPTLITVLG